MTSNAPAHRHFNFFPKERMMKSNHAAHHRLFFFFFLAIVEQDDKCNSLSSSSSRAGRPITMMSNVVIQYRSSCFQGKKHGHSSHVEQQAFIVINFFSLASYKLLMVLCFASAQLVKEWKMN
jgi:hypothetical protein